MTESVQATRIRERRSKWWWTLAALPPIVAVITTWLAPEPHGHWSEHLTSVGLETAQLALLLALVSMLGWRTLRLLVLIAFAVTIIGIVLQVVGNYQVAQSIWRTTGNPGFGDGYTAGHGREELGTLLVIVGGFSFALFAGVLRQVPAWLAAIAAVMVIIPPPFFWPAAGVLMLTLSDLTSRPRAAAADLTIEA